MERSFRSAKSKKKKRKIESVFSGDDRKKKGEHGLTAWDTGTSCSSSNLPCMDRPREELSCAICLEICFEPSTTSCELSFCEKCLCSVAEKCGRRCPKCRKLISNGRCCTVNTALWNTVQILFPQEVEARRAAEAPKTRGNHYNLRNQSIRTVNSPEAECQSVRRVSYHEVIN
ncbi:E3 ubiquitin-protein ligase RNF168 [Camellia lanceoleosa]|uniref:E3 ubiquitin-protein ligase RNF168 n=1 Tax=Camellia lanceoleosa TaxID=1840588 RepID=A0ACC0J1J3_9ERIC|nr:E3 ubiquitin-protein ligase RNF168 [Camellia lanceoleosa]